LASSPIPDDVARLLLGSIDTVADLEVLLFLRRRPEAEWDPNAVADLLSLDRKLSGQIFKRLAARGFLTYREEPFLLYRYGPSPEVATLIDKLANLYAERRLMVIALLAARRSTSGLRLFSEAFRLRRPGTFGS
jgi:hypothetical protein